MVQSIDDYRRRSDAARRIPPHNLEVEESLLGAMMLSRDAITAAAEARVDATDFYKPAHGHIYEAIFTLYGQGEPVDPVTVAEELRRADLLDALGGRQVLLELQAKTPASANAAHYAAIVTELALLRRLIAVAGEIAELGYDPPADLAETLDRAESLVFEVAERQVADTLSGLHEGLLEQALEELELLYGRDDHLIGSPTGFRELDQILLGLQPSQLVVVASRPAMGKTALALGIATNVAITTRKPVLVFSMEMGQNELTKRLIASEARVDSRRIATGKLQEADWPRVTQAIGRLAEAPIFIDDNPHCTVMEMRAKARRIKARQGGIGLIVVDYLQLMTASKRAESRVAEVSELSRGLKILARELDVPVMALSQLNRQLEYRTDKRPMLADLRESGCLTADAVVSLASGERVAMGELLERGARDVPVWTLDKHYRLAEGVLTHVFPSGVKPTFELRLASGRSVTASANHPFLTVDGWRRVDELTGGAFLATASRVPQSGPNRVRTLVGALAGGRRDGAQPAPLLADLASPDVHWDRLLEIVPRGEQPVYDATVPGTHNFVANGIVAHNSIEQDADVVCFIYRDEAYNPDSERKGEAEIIVAKHRNGPTGSVRLAFLEQYTKFHDMARD